MSVSASIVLVKKTAQRSKATMLAHVGTLIADEESKIRSAEHRITLLKAAREQIETVDLDKVYL